MSETKPARWYTQHWQDIGFTALPIGWINVWKLTDGTYFTDPCPGVLIQESTEGTWYWDEPGAQAGKAVLRSRPDVRERETRTVFAYCEEGCADLQPVDDVRDSYVTTTTAEVWNVRKEES